MASVMTDDVSVVIVEDDRDLADLYKQYLQDEFHVRVATTTQQARELVDESVDVVLLDRRMPDTSGDELLGEIRAEGYDMPIAMVTAVEPGEDIVELPFDDYLTKPFDRDALIRTVRILANRASFEAKSREFFRLASKKASLDGRKLNDTAPVDSLVHQLEELQEDLDETVHYLLQDDSDAVNRSRLDDAEIHALLAEIGDHSLPEEIRGLIDAYLELETARPLFMWKWVHRLAPQNTLPCVLDQYTEQVPANKTLLILFITILDDILERQRDRRTFTELTKIPFHPSLRRNEVNEAYVEVALDVWETLEARLREAPAFDRYEPLMRYDIRQAIDAIEYSHMIIEHPGLATMSDLERYESHNMVMLAYADIDLMYSPLDVQADLPTLREAIWTAQLMARIGNWVSTWERELREGDYSSGVVVTALEEGIVSQDELAQLSAGEGNADEVVSRITHSGIETDLLTTWEHHFHQLKRYDDDLETIDLGSFIEGTEEVLRYHLASTGLK